ncbi:hypothetical protein V6C27_13755 [Peptococcaceae bacterium 1198_IL3148]
MKIIKTAISVLFFLIMVALPANSYASQDQYGNYYREARIFGKVINDHIVFGSLMFRANNGEYINYADKTYWQVYPMYPDDLLDIQNNIDKTVVINCRMFNGQAYGQETVAFYNVKQVNYNIELSDEIVFGRLKSPYKMIGFSIDKDSVLKDLLQNLKSLSNVKLEDSSETNRKAVYDLKNNSLLPVWLLAKNEDVENNLESRTDLLVIAELNQGNNHLVNAVDISEGHIKNLLSNVSLAGSCDIDPGPMAIYGKIDKVKKEKENIELVYIEGAAANNFDGWKKIFIKGTDDPSSIGEERIRVSIPANEVKKGEYIFVAGTKVYDDEENEYYVRPDVYLNKDELLHALTVLRNLTN